MPRAFTPPDRNATPIPMASHCRHLRCSTEPPITLSPASATALQAPEPSFMTLSSALTKERRCDRTFSSRSSSFSSLLLHKIRLWTTSCFSGIQCRGLRLSAASAPAPPKTSPPYPCREPWDPGLSSRREDWMPRRSSSPPSAVYPVEKPLRESEPVLPRPVPSITMISPPIPSDDHAIGTVGSRKDRESTVVISASSPNEDRFVWAKKYRPKSLKEFICNRDRAEELLQMVAKKTCSHFIFEGPPGVGKKTMVLAYLRDAFGPEKLKTNNELKKIELKGEFVSSIDINVRISSQHIEVNLSDLHGYEKHVLASFINDACTPSGKAVHCDHTNCRAIVIYEADKLSTDAQHYLLWLMEKYKGCNKIIFFCSDSSKLQIIRHLCKIVKLLPPSDSEIVEVLEFITRQECIDLPHDLAKRIAENSKHNLRQAIRSFEASWKSSYSFKENHDILTGWEEDIAKIAKNIVEEQSPKQLYIIRGKLKNLIEHDVSPDFIFSTLKEELKKLVNAQCQAKLDALYQDFNDRDNGLILKAAKSPSVGHDKLESSGCKLNDPKNKVRRFMSIEEFAAKFMSFYKSAATNNSGGPSSC